MISGGGQGIAADLQPISGLGNAGIARELGMTDAAPMKACVEAATAHFGRIDGWSPVLEYQQANVAAFLLSDAASFVTRANIPIDGRLTAAQVIQV